MARSERERRCFIGVQKCQKNSLLSMAKEVWRRGTESGCVCRCYKPIIPTSKE